MARVLGFILASIGFVMVAYSWLGWSLPILDYFSREIILSGGIILMLIGVILAILVRRGPY